MQYANQNIVRLEQRKAQQHQQSREIQQNIAVKQRAGVAEIVQEIRVQPHGELSLPQPLRHTADAGQMELQIKGVQGVFLRGGQAGQQDGEHRNAQQRSSAGRQPEPGAGQAEQQKCVQNQKTRCRGEQKPPLPAAALAQRDGADLQPRRVGVDGDVGAFGGGIQPHRVGKHGVFAAEGAKLRYHRGLRCAKKQRTGGVRACVGVVSQRDLILSRRKGAGRGGKGRNRVQIVGGVLHLPEQFGVTVGKAGAVPVRRHRNAGAEGNQVRGQIGLFHHRAGRAQQKQQADRQLHRHKRQQAGMAVQKRVQLVLHERQPQLNVTTSSKGASAGATSSAVSTGPTESGIWPL